MVDIGARSIVKLDVYGDQLHLFIEGFLLPEAISVVVSKDYVCSLDDAFHLSWLSEPFGLNEYPDDNKCPILRRIQHASSVTELRHQYEMGEEAFLNTNIKALVAPEYVCRPIPTRLTTLTRKISLTGDFRR